MALQTILGGLWVPRPPLAVSTTPSLTTTTLLIDASGEKAAFVFQAPKAGAVRKILWHTGTVTTGGTVDVRLETVDATTGDPTGTLVGTTTNGSTVVAGTDDDRLLTTTLTLDATVVQGTWYAAVIVRDAVAGNMQIAGFADEISYGTYCDLFTASWAKQATCCPVLGLEYSDGSYAPIQGCYLVGTATTAGLNAVSFGNGTTPDVRALRFRLPFPARARGFWAWMDLDGDCAVKLYGSDGVTVLASVTLDTNLRSATNAGLFLHDFTATATLAANTTYRLGLEPSTATAIISYEFDVPAAAAMDAHPGGQAFHLSTAKDPTGTGSWTDVATSRPWMGLLLDALDDAVSAGGGGGLKLVGAGGLAG